MNIENIAKELNKNFAQLVDVQMKSLQKLQKEYEGKKIEIENDIQQIMQMVKNGDLNQLNVLKEKYAGNNSQ